MVQGQFAGPMVTVVTAVGCSRLPVSSTARLLMLAVPSTPGRQLNVQFSRPAARRHVDPPSTETSMPPTTPPPLSVAVPLIVTSVSAGMLTPFAGDAIADVGGATSVLGTAGNNPGCRVCGWIPISPKRFIVACWMFGSGEAEPVSGP